MPLRSCPDCGSEVSTSAAACPKCGHAFWAHRGIVLAYGLGGVACIGGGTFLLYLVSFPGPILDRNPLPAEMLNVFRTLGVVLIVIGLLTAVLGILISRRTRSR